MGDTYADIIKQKFYPLSDTFLFLHPDKSFITNMNYKPLLMALMIAASTIVSAQKNAVIKFDTLFHNFGSIHEEAGKVTYKYLFKNAGKDTLKINFAEPSCSCTSTDYTKTPVPPGGTGFVTATFDPIYKHGDIEKSVNVNSNSTTPNVTLNFKVNVIPRTKTFNDSFPVKNGNLYFGYRKWNLKTITIDEDKKDSMELFNSSAKPMKLSFVILPEHIIAYAKPETISPNSRGKIFVNYNAAKKNQYGIIDDQFILLTDDETSPSKTIEIGATITDDFDKLTAAQKKDAPRINFVTKEIMDIGEVKEGEKVKTKFDFVNTGKSPLIIRAATSGQEDVNIIMPANYTIESQGAGAIGFEFSTEGKIGSDVRRTILVTTNDPIKSFFILIVKMSIIAK